MKKRTSRSAFFYRAGYGVGSGIVTIMVNGLFDKVRGAFSASVVNVLCEALITDIHLTKIGEHGIVTDIEMAADALLQGLKLFLYQRRCR